MLAQQGVDIKGVLKGSWDLVTRAISKVTVLILTYSLNEVLIPMILHLVAEWIHFTLFGIILLTLKIKVYTFWVLCTLQLSPSRV